MLSLKDLARLADQYRDDLDHDVAIPVLSGRPLARPPHLMGVINLSPDSWYRESVCLDVEAAVRRGKRLHAEGADLVDLGAESTLLHAGRADAGLQNSRLLPVLRGLSAAGVPVSVETYLPAVAEAALQAGAAVLNLTGTAHAAECYRLAAARHAGVIICYVAAPNVREAGDLDLTGDHFEKLAGYFQQQIDLARAAGVQSLWLDPGLGFYYRNLRDSAARIRYQAATFLQTFRLRRLGHPVCHALPHAFETFGEEVRCAEPFFAVLAQLGQAGLLRTHEVARVKAVIDTLRLLP